MPLLIFAGAFNGLILSGLAALLCVAWRRRDLLDGYAFPGWLAGAGTVAWLLTIYLGWQSLARLGQLLR